MSMVVYVNPSCGDNPGHAVIGEEPAAGPRRYFGFRFSPPDLPADYQAADKWRSYLFENTVKGNITDETRYVRMMEARGFKNYREKRAYGVTLAKGLIPPRSKWRRFANYSFNPDSFHTRLRPCYNCVSWAVSLANKVVAGFLEPVEQGRVKHILLQLTPLD